MNPNPDPNWKGLEVDQGDQRRVEQHRHRRAGREPRVEDTLGHPCRDHLRGEPRLALPRLGLVPIGNEEGETPVGRTRGSVSSNLRLMHRRWVGVAATAAAMRTKQIFQTSAPPNWNPAQRWFKWKKTKQKRL